MKRILMRSGKSPFDIASPGRTLEENIIGGNNGNLLFASAAHKLLSVSNAEVESTYNRIDPNDADRVNDEFDAFVIPLANGFRPDFEGELLRITKFIEKLRIPVMMLSGGAQSGPDGGFANLEKMAPTIKRFGRAVLDKSSAITVRGEKTAAYLRSLGLRDVAVIGCPSLTYHGPDFAVKRAPHINKRSNIAYNVETSKDFLAATVDHNQRKYRNLTYLPQDRRTLEVMMWGGEAYGPERDQRLPLHSSHPQFQDRMARYFIDPRPWMDFLATCDLSFGPRIHGNIAAVLSGTPAVVTAHDSRTLELARYHELPCITADDIAEPLDAKDIAAHADYTKFNAGQRERFERVSKHLKSCGFDNIFEPQHKMALEGYEKKIKELDFPQAVRYEWSSMSSQMRDRFEILRRQKARTDKNVLELRAKLKSLETRLTRLESDSN